MTEESQSKFGRWHDRNYKKLLLVPALLLIAGIVFMGVFYAQNEDFVYKDISLTGGTSVTINEKIDAQKIKEDLEGDLENINTREISDLTANQQTAVVVETTSGENRTRQVLEDYLGYELDSQNSSFSFTGSSLSQGFYKQLLIALLIAFVFMGIVVFVIFRTSIPSIAVIVAAFADIFMTLVLVNVLGIEMSTAGIVAFLLLLGYSVDTDILLTNRVLRRGDQKLNGRLFGAFKTGTKMTLTSLFAFIIALLIVQSFSDVLTKILTILVIGLGFDLLNTWITNASIIKWYAKRKGLD